MKIICRFFKIAQLHRETQGHEAFFSLQEQLQKQAVKQGINTVIMIVYKTHLEITENVFGVAFKCSWTKACSVYYAVRCVQEHAKKIHGNFDVTV